MIDRRAWTGSDLEPARRLVVECRSQLATLPSFLRGGGHSAMRAQMDTARCDETSRAWLGERGPLNLKPGELFVSAAISLRGQEIFLSPFGEVTIILREP